MRSKHKMLWIWQVLEQFCWIGQFPSWRVYDTNACRTTSDKQSLNKLNVAYVIFIMVLNGSFARPLNKKGIHWFLATSTSLLVATNFRYVLQPYRTGILTIKVLCKSLVLQCDTSYTNLAILSIMQIYFFETRI